MSTASHHERAASFGRGADVYQATRPSYPDEVVRWCVPDDAQDVLDLAAGTGKLTQRLVALGLHTIAVEPSDGMRRQLVHTVPDADARPGDAEHTGLPDASVDAVTVATAWHWFDEAAASAEIARVLRPGGQVAVVWNIRDDDVDWVAQFVEISTRGDELATRRDEPSLGPAFTVPEHATFRWSQPIRTADLRALAASRSHLLTLPEVERDALLDEIDHLAAAHPDLRGRDEVPMPYRTEAWRARLR